MTSSLSIFGAHYTKGGLDDYKIQIRTVMAELKRLPCPVCWREYAPAHFDGPSGRFQRDTSLNVCAHAEVGETEYNAVTRQLLRECGAACSHIRWLPIWDVYLPRHGSHAENHVPDKARGF